MSSRIFARHPRAGRMRGYYRHVLWLAVLVTGVAVGVAPGQRAGAAVAAVTCKPYWFIGARGSGEKATEGAAMGKEVYYLYSQVSAAFAKKGVAVAFMPVNYPADPVTDLLPSAAVLTLIHAGQLPAAVALYIKTSVDKYDASMTQGVKQVEADVAKVLGSCPGARIILGGYSQGAVAVHDAENWLTGNKPAEFAHIAGTLLLGDPDRVPNTKAKEFGGSLAKREGLRVYLHLVKPHDVPRPASTANIARPNDFVGDFQGITTLLHAVTDVNVHTSYQSTAAGRKLLTAAAVWVVGQIHPVLATKLPAATVGQHYSAQLTTSDHRKGTWKIASGTLPAGLSLSGSTISGTPTTAGTAKFTLKFTDPAGQVTTAAATLSVLPASTSWTATQAPVPANAAADPDAVLYDVACPSASACSAVGTYEDAQHQEGLLVTEASGKWKAIESPLPANAAADPEPFLNAIACSSASACVAVGFYNSPSAQVQQGLLVTGAAGSWKAIEAPLPANADRSMGSGISAVACAHSSSCVALGDYTDASGNSHWMLLVGSGTSWTATEAPLPAGATSLADPALLRVACPSAVACVVVGGYTDSGVSQGMLITGSGTSWTAIKAPRPANAVGSAVLEAVACVSASACTASGAYTDSSGIQQTMLVTGSGTSWAATEAPRSAGAKGTDDALPWSVSCPSSSACAAAGAYSQHSTKTFDSQILLVTGSGSSWTAPTVALPLNAGANSQTDLQAMTCASVSACAAGGFYTDTSGFEQGLIVTGSGTKWTAIDAPLPANAGPNPVGEVFAIACPSTTTCVAAASYEDSSGNFQGLLLTGPA